MFAFHCLFFNFFIAAVIQVTVIKTIVHFDEIIVSSLLEDEIEQLLGIDIILVESGTTGDFEIQFVTGQTQAENLEAALALVEVIGSCKI